MRKKYILFDLDGTLTDSSEGITKSVQYALDKLGITENDEAVLKRYIGPPLDESFAKFHGLSREDALKAVNYYRERYKDTGIYENRLFDGIKELLSSLKKEGYITALATCKPEPFALKILEHFNLSKYFTVACGSNLDGTRKYKNEIIEEVFARLNRLEGNGELTEAGFDEMKADSIMVGDRKDDIYGAHNADIEAVGVRFGYAADGELEEAGADYIVNTVFELTALLLMDDDSVLCD
mgnify:CR=1 FL=1